MPKTPTKFAGDLTVTGSITVTGTQTFTGNQAVAGNQSIGGTLAVTGTTTLIGAVSVTAGAGSGSYVPAGTLSLQSSQVATAANTTETDGHSYTLPANSLNVDGKAVRVKVWGTVAANGNNKTAQLYFGGTSVYTTGAVAANAKPWCLEMLIVRTGAATQRIHISGNFNGAPVTGTVIVTNANKDLTTALVIKSTITNGSSSAGDITVEGTHIEAV